MCRRVVQGIVHRAAIMRVWEYLQLTMGLVSVYETEFEFRSLMAWGKKLLLSLSVFAIMLLKRLPDGSKQKRWLPGWVESSIHFNSARPRRNTRRYKFIVNWLLSCLTMVYNFCDRVKDKSFNLTTGAARFKLLLNSKQTIQKGQFFWCTQCPYSITRLHSLLQVNCISGLM